MQERMTSERVNGIKSGYWSPARKEELVQRLAEYENIGTVEKCREAVEKQKPKPCEFYGDEEDGKLLCPNCGEDLWDLKECGFNNCPYCGQAIYENLEGMEDE